MLPTLKRVEPGLKRIGLGKSGSSLELRHKVETPCPLTAASALMLITAPFGRSSKWETFGFAFG